MDGVLKKSRVDWVLVLALLSLFGAGLLTMKTLGSGDNYFFNRQVVWLGLGLLLFFFASSVDWRFLRNGWILLALYLFGILVLAGLLALGQGIRGGGGRDTRGVHETCLDFGFGEIFFQAPCGDSPRKACHCLRALRFSAGFSGFSSAGPGFNPDFRRHLAGDDSGLGRVQKASGRDFGVGNDCNAGCVVLSSGSLPERPDSDFPESSLRSARRGLQRAPVHDRGRVRRALGPGHRLRHAVAPGISAGAPDRFYFRGFRGGVGIFRSQRPFSGFWRGFLENFEGEPLRPIQL